MWICVGPRDPATKPSQEGWLWAVVRKPRLFLVEIAAARNKVTAKSRAYDRSSLRFTVCVADYDDDELNINPPTPFQ